MQLYEKSQNTEWIPFEPSKAGPHFTCAAAQGEKPPSRFMKDLIKEAKFLKAPDRILIIG